MAIQLQGFNGVVGDVGGSTFRALKVQQMPLDYGSLGTYRKSLISGTMAAGLAANSEVFQFRWSDATRLCAIRRIVIDGLSGSATAFAAGLARVHVTAARSWTVSGSAGNAGILTTNEGKMRTSMGTTLLGDVRIASTGALGAGTKTLDTDSIGQYSFSVGTVANVQYLNQTILFGEDPGPEHPLILAQNEGFAIRATVPATGTWQFGVTVTWSELTAF
jgi:hypothetical protein